MFCPNCKLEYRAGFTHCNDCDVDLVNALPQAQAAAAPHAGVRDLRSPMILRQGVSAADAPLIRDALNDAGIAFNERRAAAEIVADGSHAYEFWVNAEDRPSAQQAVTAALQGAEESPSADSLELLWGGSDRGFFESLCAALSAQGIDCYKYEPMESQLSASFSRNPLEVSVRKEDFEDAYDVLAALPGGVDHPTGDDAELPPPTLPADSAPADEIDDVAGDDESDDQLTSEAWSGSDAGLAEQIQVCLREIGISSRIATAPKVRLFVAPNYLARAREVVREIIEAAQSSE